MKNPDDEEAQGLLADQGDDKEFGNGSNKLDQEGGGDGEPPQKIVGGDHGNGAE